MTEPIDSSRTGDSSTAPSAAVVPLPENALGQVLDLFRELWPGKAHLEDSTTWAFGQGALGRAPLVCATDRISQKVVGVRGGIVWPLGGAGADPEARVIQLGGTGVARSHRRQGLFTSMTERFIASAEAEGFSLLFNVSVDAARAGYEKLGWQYIRGFRSHFLFPRPLRAARLVALRSSEASSIAVEAARTPHPAYPDVVGALLVREERLKHLHHTRYTEETFDWRFSGTRHCFAGNALIGFCPYMVRRRGPLREVVLGDLWPIDHDLKGLVRSVVDAEEPDLVTLWMSRSHPYRRSLVRLGFVPDPRKELNFGVRPLSAANPPTYLDPDSWACMPADIDTF